MNGNTSKLALCTLLHHLVDDFASLYDIVEKTINDLEAGPLIFILDRPRPIYGDKVIERHEI